MSIKEIGCCGAYCKTCPALGDKSCKGCTLGYEGGKRDINNARCWIKVCCFKDRKFETCADCPDFSSCRIQDWYEKGYKYSRYRQSSEFIRKEGYIEFLKKADKWNGPYGRLD